MKIQVQMRRKDQLVTMGTTKVTTKASQLGPSRFHILCGCGLLLMQINPKGQFTSEKSEGKNHGCFWNDDVPMMT